MTRIARSFDFRENSRHGAALHAGHYYWATHKEHTTGRFFLAWGPTPQAAIRSLRHRVRGRKYTTRGGSK